MVQTDISKETIEKKKKKKRPDATQLRFTQTYLSTNKGGELGADCPVLLLLGPVRGEKARSGPFPGVPSPFGRPGEENFGEVR